MVYCTQIYSWAPPLPYIHLVSTRCHSHDRCSQAFPVFRALPRLCFLTCKCANLLICKLVVLLFASFLASPLFYCTPLRSPHSFISCKSHLSVQLFNCCSCEELITVVNLLSQVELNAALLEHVSHSQ